MAEQYYPFDAGAGSAVYEADWTKIHATLGYGVANGEDNELLVTTGTGMQAVVRSGKAFCRGHAYVNTSDKTLTIDSNASTGTTRYDVIAAEWDFSANTATAVVVKGTAAVTPTVPTLTQNFTSKFQLPLAVISVAAGDTSIDSGDIHVAKDRWWRSTKALDSPLGVILPFALYDVHVPDGWEICDGRTLDALSYLSARSKLVAYVSGRAGYDETNELIYLPDMRGRVPVGRDNLGGTDSGTITTTNAFGITGGAQTVGLSSANLPAHTHDLTHTHSLQSHTHTIAHTHTGTTAAAGSHTHRVPERGDWNGPATNDYNAANSFTAQWIGAYGITTEAAANHTHTFTTDASSAANSGGPSTASTGASSAANTGSVGSGTAIDNMQPFTIVTNYIIKMFG